MRRTSLANRIHRSVRTLAALAGFVSVAVRVHAIECPAQVTACTTAPPALGTYAVTSSSADTLRTTWITTKPAVLPTTPSAEPGVTPALYEHAFGTNPFHLATAWVHATRALAAFESMLSPAAHGVAADRRLEISLGGASNSTASDSTLRFITENGRCAADDASVVVHELGHTLLYRHGIVPTSQAIVTDYPFEFYRNLEPLGLHEGTADYLQAAYTGQVEMGLYYYGYPRTSVVSDPARYHLGHYGSSVLIRPGLSSGQMQYLNGMIWSGALWDLRTAVGPVADTLVVRSLEYWPLVPTFESAADAVRYAAIQRGDVGLLNQVMTIFANRGIGTSLPVVSILDVSVRVDVSAFGAQSRVSCRAHPAGGMPPYALVWRTYDPHGVPVAEHYDVTNFSTALAESSLVVCEITDGRGHVSTDSLVVPVRCRERAHVDGPDLVTPGEPARFTLGYESCSIGAIETPLPIEWRVRYDTGAIETFGSETPELVFLPTGSGRTIGCVHDACDSLRFLSTVLPIAPAPHRDLASAAPGGMALHLAEPRRVHVAAYDVLGRRLATLANGTLAAGEHSIALPRGVPRGTLCFVRVFGTDRPLVVKLVAN